MINNNKKVMMVGPDISARGGISYIIRGYYQSGIIAKLGIDYFPTYQEGNRLYKISFYIKSLIKISYNILNYKIVHIHSASKWSFRRLGIILVISKILKRKTILHVHGGGFKDYYNLSTIFEKTFINIVMSISDHIVVLSKNNHNTISSLFGTEQITIIHNTIQEEISFNNDVNYKSNFEINILFLGHLIQRKGIFDLLIAFKNIVNVTNKVRLIICGEGHYDLLRKKISNLKISEYVDIEGWVSGAKKQKILNSCHIFVLPSYVEAFPVSLLEAMAHGIPVIATNVGGIPEIVENYIEGFIIKPGDIRMLTRRMRTLIYDYPLWQQMSVAARKKIKKEYTPVVAFLQLKTLYDSLLLNNPK